MSHSRAALAMLNDIKLGIHFNKNVHKLDAMIGHRPVVLLLTSRAPRNLWLYSSKTNTRCCIAVGIRMASEPHCIVGISVNMAPDGILKFACLRFSVSVEIILVVRHPIQVVFRWESCLHCPDKFEGPCDMLCISYNWVPKSVSFDVVNKLTCWYLAAAHPGLPGAMLRSPLWMDAHS